MQCPKCKGEELKKHSFNAPYLCPICGGMWRQGGDSAELTEVTLEPLEGEGDPGEMDRKTGLCPVGHGIMVRARVELDEPFYLERCTTCGGIWFDKGEWQRIAEHNLADSLPAIWSKAWQRRQRQEKDREGFLEMNRKLLGEELFEAVMDLAVRLKDHPGQVRAVALLQQEMK